MNRKKRDRRRLISNPEKYQIIVDGINNEINKKTKENYINGLLTRKIAPRIGGYL